LIPRIGRTFAYRQRAAAQARAVLDASLEAVVGMDEHGVVVEWNRQAELTFGWSRAEAMSKLVADLIIPARYRTQHLTGLARYLRTGEGPVLGKRLELDALARDGHEFPVELSIVPVRTRAGRMFSASIRDLTSQRDAARARVILEERLRQSERLESVGRLVGGIAHDFNNLLAIVLNYTDFVSERLPPDDPNQADLLQIRSAAERATGFTRQLLTFAKRNPVKAEDIDINAIIGQLRELLRRTLPASIAVDLRLGDGLWSVHADRGQLEQVVLNLVVNAGDAMPEGGRLVVGTSNVEYDDDSATQHLDLAPGRYVYLTVTDTGAGMTKEILDHAFEPFFTTKTHGQGTGLGLATAYGVVQQAGGRISLYSELGKGTTARVLLPAGAALAAAAAPMAVIPATRETGGARTILVVEDEDGVREAARRILSSAGYLVLQIARPDDAVALMRGWTKPIDLLLTDMVMPGMSGRELASHLRIQRPRLPVVYMTGYSEELLDPGADVTADEIISKPFTREPLLAAVTAALASRRSPER
jgi:PAS domain S-box-containing protein